MKLVFGYHAHTLVQKVIEKELENFGIAYTYSGSGQIQFMKDINNAIYEDLKQHLLDYGIYIHENPKEQLVQRVKDVVDELVNRDESYPYKTSQYISDKMDMSYGYLSNLFSEVTLTTLEFYIILKKIERAKAMILNGEHNLTEIAFKLNYSSVAHLSGQFKKITGITSSAFVRIMEKRNYGVTFA
jgi:AraC-like DNA-binding protein